MPMTPDWGWSAGDTTSAWMIGMMTLTYLGYHYGLSADRFRHGLARHGECV
ncbi:MAG: hypothetical protein H7338_10950, partial [Candidatus Sericytochromatia bacterium]|nr:hypothetical protein [Candidatus Sericytochromatia bacterium]